LGHPRGQMARARTRVHQDAPGDSARRATAASAGPQARPDIHAAAVAPEAMRALQHVAGNAAARRVRPVATAPEGPQRLWTDTEFKAKMYEGAFTQKSSAQVA